MSIVSKQYTGNGSTKNFASDFKILSESHVDVLVNGVSISKSDYDTINSSVVFAAAPASGAAVVVRVGTTPDDLLTSTTNIDTVAANIADINTIEDNLTAINTTATNISSVTTNATNISNINTVADIGSDGLQGIVDNVDNIETVASVYNQVQTVAGIANAVSTVSSNSAAIVAAGDNTTNINTVAGNSTNINTLAADIAEINEIYTNRAEIYQADTNAATATAQATIATTKASQASASASAASSSASAASSSASAASGSASTATTQASNASASASAASSSATSASNSASAAASSASSASSSASTATTKANEASASALSASNSLDSFNDNYTSSTTAPTSPEEGALWFDETTDIMKVYNGSSWQSAGSSVNGTSERQTYTATSGQTTFNATYDSGFVDVYLNGLKLADSDFTATNGTTIVLTSGATAGDIVDIVAYGTFELADVYTQAQADVLLAAKADANVTYTETEVDNLLDAKADQATTYTKTEVNDKPSGFKNYIINGGFDVWQRGTSFDVGSSTYTSDRWLARDGVISRSTEVPEGQGFKYSAFYDNDGTRSTINLRYIIEDGLTIFNGMTLSLSYWIKPNINCTINNDLHDTTNLSTDLQANTWTKVTKTWSNIDTSSMGDSFSGGLFIDFNIGNSYPDFYITGVQIEEGSVATPFEHRPYGLELSLCQRYYQKSYNPEDAPGTTTSTSALHQRTGSTSNQYETFDFTTNMRIPPSIVFYGTTSATNSAGYWRSSSDIAHSVTAPYISKKRFTVNYNQTENKFISGHFTADAEL